MRSLTLLLLVASGLALKFDDCEQQPKGKFSHQKSRNLRLIFDFSALNQVQRVGPKLYSHKLDFYHQKSLPYNAIPAFTDVFLHINLTDADQYQFYQVKLLKINEKSKENVFPGNKLHHRPTTLR